MHAVIKIAEKLGAKRATQQLVLALEDPAAYLAKFALRLAERGVTGPRKDLSWIALVDALDEEELVAELDHRTFPEDVIDALDELRTMPKRRGRWNWAKDIDEGTATSDFLALAAHHAQLSLLEIDLGSDSLPVVIARPQDVAALVKCGCTAIEPRAALPKLKKRTVSEAKLIAEEDQKPHEKYRYVVAGIKRADEVFGVIYGEAYLSYPFYDELRARLGYEKTQITTKSGFPSRAMAVATAEHELARRVAKGWTRVSRTRMMELHEAVRRR